MKHEEPPDTMMRPAMARQPRKYDPASEQASGPEAIDVL